MSGGCWVGGGEWEGVVLVRFLSAELCSWFSRARKFKQQLFVISNFLLFHTYNDVNLLLTFCPSK